MSMFSSLTLWFVNTNIAIYDVIISIFSIFYYSQCTAVSDTSVFGTCYAESECAGKGGTVNGNCAAGFGVCCTFV